MLLSIRDLSTSIRTDEGLVRAVQGVSLDVPAGRTVALVGESGCGKSMTAMSILRLLPPGGRIDSGHILFEGRDLAALAPPGLRQIRGNRIAMIFQEPLSCLNPVLSVGQQVAQPLRLHKRMSRRSALHRAAELLAAVAIPDAARRARQYPHELSGGMRQRVMIAMAIACEPALLIADEPTTALDVTVQAQILALLADLQRRRGTAILLITHDLGVVAQLADSTSVMYRGRIVEQAMTAALFRNPGHPYTRALLRSVLRLRRDPAGATNAAPRGRLPVIEGEVPGPLVRIDGCPFHPRCQLGREDSTCRTAQQSLAPPVEADGDASHVVACWKTTQSLAAR